MTQCPACGANAGAAKEFCPSCLGPLGQTEAKPVSPSEVEGQRGGLSEVDVRRAAEEADARQKCGKHPDRPVVGTCTRCGAFICVVCAPDFVTDAERPCESCQAVLDVTEAPVRADRTMRAVGVLGLAFATIWIVVGWGLGPLLGAVIIALPYVILSVLMIIFRASWIGYVLIVLEALATPVVTGFSLRATLLLASLPIFSVLMIQDAKRIRAMGKRTA